MMMPRPIPRATMMAIPATETGHVEHEKHGGQVEQEGHSEKGQS